MTPAETLRHHALTLHDLADRVARVSRTVRGVPLQVVAMLGEVEERTRACADDLTAIAEGMDGDGGVRRDEGQSPSERAALVDAGRGHLCR